MPNKYLELTTAGAVVEKEASAASAGAGDAGKLVALDSSGLIAESMLPPAFGADQKSIVCSEDLSAGNLVNVYDDSGTLKVRKADATTAGKEANGWVKTAYTSGQSAVVYMEQKITGLTGLTIGALYFLSTTAGAATTTAPTGSGNIVQRIGRALSTTELQFMPGDTFQRA